MRRIHGQRGQHREDVGAEIVAQPLACIGRQIVVEGDADVVLRELLHQDGVDSLHLGLKLTGRGLAFLELLRRGAAVYARGMHPGGDLLLETADAFHEEFIEVVADDR